MNEEIKKEWLEALRGGEYKQTGHALQADGGFCCLGVLCDIYAKKNGVEWNIRPFDETVDNARKDECDKIGDFLGQNLTLPSEVMEWAEVFHTNPHTPIPFSKEMPLLPYDTGFTVAAMNDEGFTFSQIADVIEHFL